MNGRPFAGLVCALLIGIVGCVNNNGASSGANAIVDRWTALMTDKPADTIVFTGELTQGGGWNGARADDAKVAFLSGAIEATVVLPGDEPPAGPVTWANGMTLQASLISASAAFEGMVTELKSGCDGCEAAQPIHVTGAKLTTAEAVTARGNATVPVWEFTFAPGEEPIDPVSYVAVKNHVSRLDWPGGDHSPQIESAYAKAADTHMTVAFVGGDCDTRHSMRVAESGQAIVPLLTTSTKPGPCDAVGVIYGLEVQLAAPIGDRVVLDPITGFPVPVYSENPPSMRPG